MLLVAPRNASLEIPEYSIKTCALEVMPMRSMIAPPWNRFLP